MVPPAKMATEASYVACVQKDTLKNSMSAGNVQLRRGSSPKC